MGYSSVDIDALTTLVATLKQAQDSITTDTSTVSTALEGGPVSAAPLTGAAPEIGDWMDEQYRLLRRQLGYARWLDASMPGVQRVVGFDQSLVVVAPAEATARAEELMEMGPPPTEELLTLLETYGGDSDFALSLFGGYRADESAASSDSGPHPDLSYLKDLGTGPEAERFLQLYSRTLSGLTYEFPLAGAQDFPQDGSPDDYRAMALLASRGDWSPQWLTQLGNDMIQAERADPELWTKHLYGGEGTGRWDSVDSVLDPQGLTVDDPMVWLMDALSRNPEAANGLFGGGGDAEIKSDGDEVDIAANLRWLTLERPWNQDQGLSLSLALGAARSLDDPDFAHDFDALENLDPVEKKSWYSFFTHLGLDVVGLVPGLGEWADGLNAAIYVGEGDYVSAGAAGASAVPVFGSTATIAKWVRQLGKDTSKVLTATTLQDLINELDLTDQDPSAGTLRTVENPTFLTSTDERRWYEHLPEAQPARTYVLEGGVVLRTDLTGRIYDVEGDTTVLDAGEQEWITRHQRHG